MLRLKDCPRDLFEAITNIQSQIHRPKVSFRSWMIKYGLRRFYYTLAHHCPDCNEPRKAVFRLHPFPVPARYGKGDWFYSDCSCIFSARRQERNQFQAMISQDFVDPLPVALRGHSFVNFKVGEYNRDAYEACTSFAKILLGSRT